MGVDIGFHIEVRKRGKWEPVVWRLPKDLALSIYEDTKVECLWIEHDAIISGRYYHFEDFLESTIHSLPNDISDRFKKIFEDDHESWGNGYFYLSDLVNYIDQVEYNAVVKMLNKRDRTIKTQLNRIEALLKHEHVVEEPGDVDDEEDYGYVENAFHEYQGDTFLIKKLRDTVLGITDAMCLDDAEIRILYFAC